MPLGICSAQEVFQKKMDRIFEGLPGVHIIVDGILVVGSTVEEHDDRLRVTFAIARKKRNEILPKDDATMLYSAEILWRNVDKGWVKA